MEIDIPENLKPFVNEVVDSFIMWDLLVYFAKKGAEPQTVSGISQVLGRPPAEVAKPLEKLVKLGLVLSEKGADDMLHRLNDKSIQYPVFQEFTRYNESQENRLRILSYLLHKRVR